MIWNVDAILRVLHSNFLLWGDQILELARWDLICWHLTQLGHHLRVNSLLLLIRRHEPTDHIRGQIWIINIINLRWSIIIVMVMVVVLICSIRIVKTCNNFAFLFFSLTDKVFLVSILGGIIHFDLEILFDKVLILSRYNFFTTFRFYLNLADFLVLDKTFGLSK